MKFLKFSFLLLSILVILIAIIYLLSKLYSKIDFNSYTKESSKNEGGVNVIEDGVIFNDFDTTDIKWAFFGFVNGENGVKVVKYNLGDNTATTIFEMQDVLFEYYVPGKVLLDSDSKYIYYILRYGDESRILKSKFSSNDYKEVFTLVSYNLLGMHKFSDRLYVTAYKLLDEGLYDSKIIEINLSDFSFNYIYENNKDEKIPVLVNIDNDAYFFKFYNRYTNKLTQECFSSTSFVRVSCATAFDVDFTVIYRAPEGDNGFALGKTGFLQKEYRDGTIETLLDGVPDEQFESPFVINDGIYFLSGQIVPFGISSDSENFGSFVPNAIEYFDEQQGRVKLVNLPSSKQAHIEYANKDFVLLSIELISSNKYETNPLNLWYLNLKTKKLEQITKIACAEDLLCEVEFLEFAK